MRKTHLDYLACPQCSSDLSFLQVTDIEGDVVRNGMLRCGGCSSRYPVVRSIPRFVPGENYASGFGFQWTKHSLTQYDSHTGRPLSKRRFFDETGWPPNLAGETVLEVGCGSGRFTEQALSTGALVVSLDYSYSVDANHEQNGDNDNLLVVQADVCAMPLRDDAFDKVFCFGTLQHTPNPRQSFEALVSVLKPGGELVADIYKKNRLGRFFSFTPAPPTKYYVRPITTRMRPESLYSLVGRYVDAMWGLSRWVARIPGIGRNLNWLLLIADHRNLGLSENLARQWARLNTFDMLAPKYDLPQTLATVQRWFREADMTNCRVEYGHNGIVGRGTRRP
ncbi:methyltransferase domain-containing protein [Planctomycetota bacterium]